ncbi:MAG: type VI secretion system lipoprotein TssJ [Rhizobacter sp.]|nr:type VI secretion system lipoprotein TssJ [Rhizobacter sp.]
MQSNAKTSNLSRRLLLAAALSASVSLPGCAMFGGGKTSLEAKVAASAEVNPDSRKRPSPVVVRVFELKSPTLFEQADFVSLFEKDQAVLGAEMISREEFVLRPGETKPLVKPLSPDTKFIGVMVAFRELERARWRAVVPVAAGKKNVMAIDLSDITVQAKRTSPKP